MATIEERKPPIIAQNEKKNSQYDLIGSHQKV